MCIEVRYGWLGCDHLMITILSCDCGEWENTIFRVRLELRCPNCTNELYLDEMARALLEIDYFQRFGWQYTRDVIVPEHLSQMKVT